MFGLHFWSMQAPFCSSSVQRYQLRADGQNESQMSGAEAKKLVPQNGSSFVGKSCGLSVGKKEQVICKDTCVFSRRQDN